jgi:hypothetical protein
MSEDTSQSTLKCVGSFKAYAQDGTCHTVEIWTYFNSVHDRERSRVERVAQGEYRLTENPEVSLSTDDPHAP